MTSKQRAYLRGLANKIDAIFQIGKNGIVKDKLVHEKVLTTVTNFTKDYGYTVKHLDFSPILNCCI